MNQHHSAIRKIDPTRGTTLPDGSPNDNDRVEIGPTQLAFREWEDAGLTLPNLANMRAFRHRRLVEAVNARDYGGVLLFDPLNIRYATDSTNMQLWNTHNAFRACLVCADGYMVVWDYKNAMFLSKFNHLVMEQRSGADLFYFDRGDKIDVAADEFSNQVRTLIAEHGGANKRLGVDKIMIHGLRALEAQGFDIIPGEELTEKARSIKGVDEILAMRCASHACEAACFAMEDAARKGVPNGNMSEDDIWAILHAENIIRGGEWIETRLLSSGPRTNPWFQECGPRIVQNNPGLTIPELIEKSHRLPDKYQQLKYGCMMHGVGLCDEWPLVAYPDQAVTGAFDYAFEPGMTLCVEALISPEGGDFSIKLEDQVLITEDGFENLTKYPHDPRLLGY